jgi:hypothetical protein
LQGGRRVTPDIGFGTTLWRQVCDDAERLGVSRSHYVRAAVERMLAARVKALDDDGDSGGTTAPIRLRGASRLDRGRAGGFYPSSMSDVDIVDDVRGLVPDGWVCLCRSRHHVRVICVPPEEVSRRHAAGLPWPLDGHTSYPPSKP